jgi:hypothetical protein
LAWAGWRRPWISAFICVLRFLFLRAIFSFISSDYRLIRSSEGLLYIWHCSQWTVLANPVYLSRVLNDVQSKWKKNPQRYFRRDKNSVPSEGQLGQWSEHCCQKRPLKGHQMHEISTASQTAKRLSL